jgi:putative transcription antitermination factor YqgF
MKILGIDFGLSTIGLAIAEGPLADPLGQVRWESAEKLIEFISRHNPDLVVLGLPEGQLTGQVETLGDQIKTNLGIEVFFQDETLSTHEAKEKLLAAGKPQKKRRLDHAAAAAVILQAYLDDHIKS